MRTLLTIAGLMLSVPLGAAPCTGIDRVMTDVQKQAWEAVIARQLESPGAEVQEVFRRGKWRVIYVNTHRSDNGFLFYRDDPLRNRYITIWGGAAQGNEQADVEHWVLANARGIPPALAKCFAWHVAHDRDK